MAWGEKEAVSRQDPTDVAPEPLHSTRTEKGGRLPRARGPRDLFDIIWETYSGYRQDRGLLLSSALAYYALFAMGPLVMVSVAIVDFAIGEQQASGQFYVWLERLLGAELAGVIVAGHDEPGVPKDREVVG